MATSKATRTAARTRRYLTTGAAVASAAAIVAVTPTLVPSQSSGTGGGNGPRQVSAKYELTAISDITVQGISDSYWFGWGDYIGGGFDPNVLYPPLPDGSAPFVSDPYYPNINGVVGPIYNPDDPSVIDGYYYNQNPVYVQGVSGVLYYLIDNILDTNPDVDFNLDNYFFEAGWLNNGQPNAGISGLGAVIYVATNEIFGSDSPIGKLAKTIFYYGTYPSLVGALVSAITAAVPYVNVGPLVLGGGILAHLYFYGQSDIPTDNTHTTFYTYNYGIPGVSAVVSYIATGITSLFPGSAATAAPGAAASLVSAKATSEEAPSAAKTASAGTTDGLKAESDAADSEQAPDGTGSADAGEATEGGDSAGSGDTATDDATTGGEVTGTDAGAPASTGSSATGGLGKPAKPARKGPISQITSKVKSALGGGKKAGGAKKGSHGSDSSSDSSASKGGSSGSDS